MKRFRRLRRRWPVILVVFLVLLVYAAWPGSSTFTISKETTYITEPIDADGFVDYQSALNQRMSEGITPENNANVLIWRALGPHPEGGTMPPEYFKWLGIESPPEQGTYFIQISQYAARFLNDKADNQPEDLDGPPPSERTKLWNAQIEQASKVPWKRIDQPDIADWLERNEKPLASTIEASKRPRYFHPLVSKARDRSNGRMIGSLLPSVMKCRELALALSCRSMNRVADGDSVGAWQDLMATQRLGRLLTSSATMIEMLSGLAIVSIATNAQIALLASGQYSSAQVLRWLQELRTLSALPSVSEKLDAQRFMLLDSLYSVATFGAGRVEIENGRVNATPPDMDFWDKLFTRNIDFDQSFRNANQTYDDIVAATLLTDRLVRKAEYDRILREIDHASENDKTIVKRFFSGRKERGKWIGNKVISLLLPAVEKVRNALDRIGQTQSNLQVAFALAAFHADTGRYPARLDELAPKYLPTIPGDLFSDKPLTYRPTENGYLLYGVGVNGIDEDGRWTNDEPPGDDLRVRMPVPEPKVK